MNHFYPLIFATHLMLVCTSIGRAQVLAVRENLHCNSPLTTHISHLASTLLPLPPPLSLYYYLPTCQILHFFICLLFTCHIHLQYPEIFYEICQAVFSNQNFHWCSLSHSLSKSETCPPSNLSSNSVHWVIELNLQTDLMCMFLTHSSLLSKSDGNTIPSLEARPTVWIAAVGIADLSILKMSVGSSWCLMMVIDCCLQLYANRIIFMIPSCASFSVPLFPGGDMYISISGYWCAVMNAFNWSTVSLENIESEQFDNNLSKEEDEGIESALVELFIDTTIKLLTLLV